MRKKAAMKLSHLTCVLGVVFMFSYSQLSAQTVGIGTDNPMATLDIHTSTPITSLNIERLLGASALANPMVLIQDESDYSVMEMFQLSITNDDVLAYFQNDGLGIGIWSTNIDGANDDPAAYFSHAGVGPGVAVYHAGTEDGISVYLDNFFNLQDAIQITHEGNGYGLFVDAYNATQNILNFVESGIGIENVHFANNAQSIVIDKGGFGFGGYSGDGYYFTNTNFLTPASGGDGFGFRGYTNTQTPVNPLTMTVYGAVLAARQYGVGHGILINHEGASGRNAEFNILSATNTDAAIFAVHNGDGSAIIAQNQDNTIAGTIVVADVAYTGTDVADHIGVAGFSSPVSNYGVGVYGYGGYIGVTGEVDPSGLAGIFSGGDFGAFGTKAFIIDHPERPETHLLKHFSIESDQVLNMYKGTAILNRSGKAEVELPSYFDDINKDFVYQLTPIGTPVQPWIAKEVEGNHFVIAGKPGSKVSWIIIANRDDAYVRNNAERIRPTQAKRSIDIGKYLDPVSHGQPKENGILYRSHPVSANPSSEETTGLASSRKKMLETAFARRLREQSAQQPANQLMKPSTERLSAPKMEIRQEIKTWDELH